MYWFSPKKEVIKYEEENKDGLSSFKSKKKLKFDDEPIPKTNVESKSFFNYLGFGGKSAEKEAKSESDDECDISDVDEETTIKKVFHQPRGLPPNFADEVLDLEMKIESSINFTQKDVDQLVYHYSQAMEFYEESSKDKYNSFKDRIHKLLTNPMVFSRMKKKEVNTRDRCLTDINRQNKPISITKKAPRCNYGPLKPIHEKPVYLGSKHVKDKKLDMSMRVLGEPLEEEKIKIMDKYNHTERSKSNIIHNDISSQTMNLQKRLAQRKFTKNSSTKTQGNSMSATKVVEQQQSVNSNDSGGFSPADNVRDLERH
jgi:hypothetical protein